MPEGAKPGGRERRIATGGRTIAPYTVGLSIVLLPFLVVASVLLYLAPGNTEQHFAWTITPPITAMYLASAYLGGVWFFGSVLRVRQWQRVRRGFPAVLLFATLLAIATLLHWDKFHAGHISFLTWATLYFTTPVLILGAMIVESRAHREHVPPRETEIPRGWRVALAVLGLVSLGVGITLFVVPSIGVDSWAWSLTPLTARVIGATLTLPGMVNLWMLVDGRWSAFRILFQAQIVSLIFIVGALAIGWSQLDFTRLSTWLLVPGLVASLAGYAGLYLLCESRSRRDLPLNEPPVNPRTV
ncbi:hypothetical protein ACLRGF_13895 [Mycetocola zhadangensis]|uniref:hypothetical protein n=1 Tax=Mycetocola zhadangensis TaxID=1164595 RepID=UPI003A4DD166